MTDHRLDPKELWCRASPKHLVVFTLIWLGEPFLMLMFAKWVIHGSPHIYLLMIPWALFGLILVMRPNWVLRVMQAIDEKIERDWKRMDKWTPPGFP
jgi:hypothetical protein